MATKYVHPLPRDQRLGSFAGVLNRAEIVRLREEECWSVRKIATHLRVNEKTIRYHLKKAGVLPLTTAEAAKRSKQVLSAGAHVSFEQVRANYGAYFLAMNPDHGYTHFQQQILAPVLEGIVAKEPKLKRTIINAPFRHSKSTFCTMGFIPFYLGHHPKATVILLSYGKRLARAFGRTIRDQMRTELYTSLFPTSTVTPSSRASDEFKTISGGKFYASGFDGTVNGLGADLLVIDDNCKNRQEAQSEAVQETQRDLYTNVARTRLEPHAAILIVTSRWTPGDLVGWRVNEDGAWDYLQNCPYQDGPQRCAA